MTILLRLAFHILLCLFSLMGVITTTAFGIASQLPLLSPGEPGAATNLQAQVGCHKTELRKGIAKLSWTVPSSGGQRVDVTIFRDGFEKGKFETSGPLPAGQTSLVWEGTDPGIIHYWRVVSLHADQSVSSEIASFEGATCVANQVR
jgi:hypothetical protein